MSTGNPVPRTDSTNPEPVKLRPVTYALNAVIPVGQQPAQLSIAKWVALSANSITMDPVKLMGQCVKDDINLVAPEQRIGEQLVIPEGMYGHCPGY